MKTCPRCGKNAHRSQRRGLVEKKLLKPLRIHPYRCHDCGYRFYRFGPHSHKRVSGGHTAIPPPDETRRRKPKDKHDYQKLVTTLREGEKKAGLMPEVQDAAEEEQ